MARKVLVRFDFILTSVPLHTTSSLIYSFQLDLESQISRLFFLYEEIPNDHLCVLALLTLLLQLL